MIQVAVWDGDIEKAIGIYQGYLALTNGLAMNRMVSIRHAQGNPTNVVEPIQGKLLREFDEKD